MPRRRISPVTLRAWGGFAIIVLLVLGAAFAVSTRLEGAAAARRAVEETGNRIDRQVRELACRALDRAVAMLSPRRELMDVLVDRLIAEETIDGDSFRQSVEIWEASHPEAAVAGEAFRPLTTSRLAVPIGES